MKVILTAFGGKLKSDPMDWPERQGPEIKMVMNMPRMTSYLNNQELEPDQITRLKRGTFEATGKFFTIAGGYETAEEYMLTDIS